jgi:hypothetical protein
MDRLLATARDESAACIRNLQEGLSGLSYTQDELRQALRKQDQSIWDQLLKNTAEGVALVKEVIAKHDAFKERARQVDGLTKEQLDREIVENMAQLKNDPTQVLDKFAAYAQQRIDDLIEKKKLLEEFHTVVKPAFLRWKDEVYRKADEIERKDQELCLKYAFYVDGYTDPNRPTVAKDLPVEKVGSHQLLHHETAVTIRYWLSNDCVPKPAVAAPAVQKPSQQAATKPVATNVAKPVVTTLKPSSTVTQATTMTKTKLAKLEEDLMAPPTKSILKKNVNTS